MCVLPQGVQRERLAHVSCLQGVVGYTASDADMLRNMLLAGGGAYSVHVYPQWRLHGKVLIATRTATSGAVYFSFSHTTDIQQIVRKDIAKGYHSALLRCYCEEERRTFVWQVLQY